MRCVLHVYIKILSILKFERIMFGSIYIAGLPILFHSTGLETAKKM